MNDPGQIENLVDEVSRYGAEHRAHVDELAGRGSELVASVQRAHEALTRRENEMQDDMETKFAWLADQDARLVQREQGVTELVGSLRSQLESRISRLDSLNLAVVELTRDLQTERAETEAILGRLRQLDLAHQEGAKAREASSPVLAAAPAVAPTASTPAPDTAPATPNHDTLASPAIDLRTAAEQTNGH